MLQPQRDTGHARDIHLSGGRDALEERIVQGQRVGGISPIGHPGYGRVPLLFGAAAKSDMPPLDEAGVVDIDADEISHAARTLHLRHSFGAVVDEYPQVT